MNGLIRHSVRAVLSAIFGVAGGLAVSWFRPSGQRESQKNESLAEPGEMRLSSAPRAAGPTDTVPTPDPDPSARVVMPRAPQETHEPSFPARKVERPAPDHERAEPDPSEPTEQMREADRLHTERHEAALRRHRDEPRDPRWATSAEEALEAELAQVGDQARFRIVKVDCRTASCVGVLEWKSYGEAQQGYGAALRQPYSVNCGIQVLLPPPLNAAAPYQASIVFDCESWRAEGH